jgi:Holliday junction resolvase RusA-like endonuclease
MYFRLKLRPVPWSRPRKGKGKHFFNTPKLEAYYRDLKLLVPQNQCLEAFWKVSIVFAFIKPKSNKNPYPTHCDTSNLIKAVEDGLNEVLWKDDRFIPEIHARKIWSEESYDYLEIMLEKLA